MNMRQFTYGISNKPSGFGDLNRIQILSSFYDFRNVLEKLEQVGCLFGFLPPLLEPIMGRQYT